MDERTALAAFSALGHATRLRVFRLLARWAPDGLAAGALARALAVPPSTLTSHLQTLERAGLIAAQRKGRSLEYALSAAGTRALVAYLTEDCCRGRPELCGAAAKR
ncbi:MAG: helix-turn-helix transcriptional regulator [Maricaulaceae bacterium]|nr:helix-turn-helix transcriptional regulator [Maricaulaceae bacterium]